MRDGAEGLTAVLSNPSVRRRTERLCRPMPRPAFDAMIARMDADDFRSFERSMAMGYRAERETWGREVAERVFERAMRKRRVEGS
jgi:hypothetical protein